MNVNEYPVRLLARMLETYSPTGKEEEISNLLVQEMERLGLRSRRDGAGNAIGEAGSGGPTVLLVGHMDTVPGWIPVRLEGDQLYGRGAVDAKAALAAMVVAASLLSKEGFQGRVVVAGAVDEEGIGRGVRHLLESKIAPDYAIFGEPSGVDNITIAYKGSLHLKITCETEAGHSSAPWLFENAVEKAFKVWNQIKGIRLDQERSGSHFYSVTHCLTGIRGGGSFSTVPSACEALIDIRIPPRITPRLMMEEVERVIGRYRSENPGVHVRVDVEDACEPYEANKNSPLVHSLSFAIRRVRKRQPTLLRKTGSGDMNLFGASTGIPVVTYGPGDSHLDHTPNEHIDLKEYLDSIQVYYEAMKKLLSRRESGEK